MIKALGIVYIAVGVFFTIMLCRASSINKNWEEEDEEQIRFLSEYAAKDE